MLATFFDLHGAASRAANPDFISSIEDAFVNTNLPLPPGPSPLWGPGGVPGEWSDVCGFSKATRAPKPIGKSAIMVPSPFPTTRWVSGKAIKVAIMKFGSTSSTSTRDWSIAFPGKTNVGQSQGRGTHHVTTARKEDTTSNTRPFASMLRVTHVTTHTCHNTTARAS